jgi:hypothetical protein
MASFVLTLVWLTSGLINCGWAEAMKPCLQYSEIPNAVVPRPLCKFTRQDLGSKITYRFNSHGLREREIKKQIPSGKTRILLLGPHMFGRGLREVDMPARWLQKELGGHFEVINMALPGFLSARYALEMHKLIANYSADWVIYVMWGSLLPIEFAEADAEATASDGLPARMDPNKISTRTIDAFEGSAETRPPNSFTIGRQICGQIWSLFFMDEVTRTQTVLNPLMKNLLRIQDAVSPAQLVVVYAPEWPNMQRAVSISGSDLMTRLFKMVTPGPVLRPKALFEMLNSRPEFHLVKVDHALVEQLSNPPYRFQKNGPLAPLGSRMWAAAVAKSLTQKSWFEAH